MKVQVISLEGEALKEIELPAVFEITPRLDLINRAIIAINSRKIQIKSNKKDAGRDNTAEYRGKRSLPTFRRSICVGRARKPRLKNRKGLLYGRVAGIPGVVGGPKAHPPKKEKKIREKINKKELRLARASAIAATGKKEMTIAGNKLIKEIKLPIVFENKLEEINKVKELTEVLKKNNLYFLVEEAKKKKGIRAGKGKSRARKYKRKKRLLFVVGEKKNLIKAGNNIEGVKIVKAKNLSVKDLAPGAKALITIYTENSLKELKRMI